MSGGASEQGLVQRGLDRWIRLVMAHVRLVLLGAVLATGASIAVAILMFDIRSDIKDLMPEDTPSVVETFQIADRMGSITPLEIIAEAPNGDLLPAQKESAIYKECRQEGIDRQNARHADLVAFAEEDKADPPVFELDEEALAHCDNGLVLFARALVAELAELDLVGYVHYRNDKAFFEDNVLLYASVDDLERLYVDIDEVLTDAKRQSGEYKGCLLIDSAANCEDLKPSLRKIKDNRDDRGPPSDGGESEDPDEAGSDGDGEGDRLDDFSEKGLRERYAGEYDDSEINFSGEYFLNQLPDGNWMIKVKVRFRDPTTSLKANKEAKAAIDEVIAQVEPKTFNPDIEVLYGGGFRAQQEQYDNIVRDIQISGGSTIGGILLLLLIFFRRFRATFIVMVPLMMSIVWTLALTFLTVGYLNLVTAFIFAILLGLGIDFGIHLLARYDEAFADTGDSEEAMRISIVEVGAANFAGAITTAATFSTLIIADFRGFSQFGIVAAMGVMVALFSMVTVMPAIVIGTQRLLPAKPRTLVGGTRMVATGFKRLLPAALLLLFSAVALAGYSAANADEVQFEENFYRLQMRKPEWKKDNRRYRVNLRHTSPAVVLTESLEEVHALERILAERRDPHATKLMADISRHYPNLFDRLQGSFGVAMTYSDNHATAPQIAMMRRVLPGSFARSITTFERFDHDATRASRLSRRFAAAYPKFSKALVGQHLAGFLPHADRFRTFPIDAGLDRGFSSWAHRLRPGRVRDDTLSSVETIVSIYSFMPGTAQEQAEKLAVIERIKKRTSRRKVRFLPAEEKERLREMRRYMVASPVVIDELPPWVKMQFKEGGVKPSPPREGSGVDYAFGKAALVYQSTSSQNGLHARRFTEEMRSIRLHDGPNEDGVHRPAMSTNAFVFTDMLTQIQSDGLDVSYIALFIVFLVVLVQHRSLGQTIVVMAPLMVALCWVVGAMIVLNLKLGFFNMVIIPVVIGIGIDDGIHLYHRYRAEGRGGLGQALRHTGGAMFMTSSTTSVGFGGMMLSQHQGLNTMGELAVIGIVSAWLSTMIVGSALILLAERFNLTSIVPEHEYAGRKPATAAA